jgi:hypothetical protein
MGSRLGSLWRGIIEEVPLHLRRRGRQVPFGSLPEIQVAAPTAAARCFERRSRSSLLGQALEVDLRPAFEKSLDQVELKFRAVPWKRDPPATSFRFMTEFLDRLSLVRGVCESWGNWNDEQRKAACRAIFWLCDQLLEDIDRRCPEEKRSYVRGKILSLRDRAEKGRTSGDFDPIRCASECDLRHWFRSEQSGPVVAHKQCIEPARARNGTANDELLL